jgi:hypothetical protein
MATYDNDLRLKEITTGDEDGQWGDSTNTNLALIADGFSLGTKQMAADANETFTMPDFSADATRSLYLKITSAVSLTATREVTLGPNTVSKTWIIENATSGSQIITIKQGSGATVNVPNGSKVMVVTDGAGAGAAVFNANPTEVGGTVTSIDVSGGTTGLTTSGGPVTTSGTITLAGTLAVANGGTGVTSSTGTGSVVLSNSPTFTGTVTADGLVVNGAAVFNEGGGDNDFRVESDTNTHALFLEGSSGNVGIGTSSPGSLLEVNTNAENVVRIRSADGTVAGILFGDQSDLSRGSIYYDNSDESMQFRVNNQIEVMRIDSSGNVGIGTNNPGGRLQIGGTTADLSNILIFGKTASAAQSTLPYISQVSATTPGTTNDLQLFAGGSGAGRIINNSFDFVVKTGGGTSPSGAERMRITSSGNVGIGTSSPTEKFHVASDDGLIAVQSANGNTVDAIMGGYMIYSADGSGPGPGNRAGIASYIMDTFGVTYDLRFYTSNNSSNLNEAMRIDSSGNVGIGTTSPFPFSSVQAGLTLSGTSGSFPTRAGALSFISQDTTSTECHIHARDAYMAFETGTSATSTERMRIDSSGNVGIGNTVASTIDTANGLGNLVVGSGSGSEGITIYTGTTGIGGLAFADGTTTTDTYRGYLKYAHSTDEMSLHTAATQRLTIDSSGNVGIGTTSPVISSGYTSLTLNNATNSGYLILQNNGTTKMDMYVSGGSVPTLRSISSALSLQATGANVITFTTNASERMRVDASGNVGIGTSNPNQDLHVYGASATVKVHATGTNSGIEFFNDATNTGVRNWSIRNNIYAYGDFSVNTGSTLGGNPDTPRLYINASGNVGIGTNSPISKLSIDKTTVSAYPTYSNPSVGISQSFFNATLNDADNYNGMLDIGAVVGNTDAFNGGSSIRFLTQPKASPYAAIERMRIDSSGRVGIGVTPSAWGSTYKVLQVGGGASLYGRADGTATQSFLGTNIYYNGTNDIFIGTGYATRYFQNNGIHRWDISSASGTAGNPITFTQAMTLDSSGNLLVGKTASNFGTAGVQLQSNGELYVTRNGGNPVSFNRLTSNGVITNFAKDGTTVGSISSNSSSYIAIGSDDTGILFYDSGDAVTPFNTTTQANAGGALDLGHSAIRWRNLYLSGGVYLGGTVAANLLDDYETGTWTPTYGGGGLSGITYATQTGIYRKIGSQVTVWFRIGTSGTFTATSGAITVSGLPFTAASTLARGALSLHDSTRWTSNPPVTGRILQSAAVINLISDFDVTGAGTDPITTNSTNMLNASGNNNTVEGSLTYFV